MSTDSKLGMQTSTIFMLPRVSGTKATVNNTVKLAAMSTTIANRALRNMTKARSTPMRAEKNNGERLWNCQTG